MCQVTIYLLAYRIPKKPLSNLYYQLIAKIIDIPHQNGMSGSAEFAEVRNSFGAGQAISA